MKFMKEKSDLKGVSTGRKSKGRSSNGSPNETNCLFGLNGDPELVLLTPRLNGGDFESPPLGPFGSPEPKFLETSPFYKESQGSFGKSGTQVVSPEKPEPPSEVSPHETSQNQRHSVSSTVLEEPVSFSRDQWKSETKKEEFVPLSFENPSLSKQLGSPPPRFIEEQTIALDSSSSNNLSLSNQQPSILSAASKKPGPVRTRDTSHSEPRTSEEKLKNQKEESVKPGTSDKDNRRLEISDLRADSKFEREDSEISFSEMLEREKEEASQFLHSFKGEISKPSSISDPLSLQKGDQLILRNEDKEGTNYEELFKRQREILEQEKKWREKRLEEQKWKMLIRPICKLGRLITMGNMEWSFIKIHKEGSRRLFLESLDKMTKKNNKRRVFGEIKQVSAKNKEKQEKLTEFAGKVSGFWKRFSFFWLKNHSLAAKRQEQKEKGARILNETFLSLGIEAKRKAVLKIRKRSSFMEEKETEKIRAFRLRRACERLREHTRLQGIKRYIQDYYKSVLLRAFRRECQNQKEILASKADFLRIKTVFRGFKGSIDQERQIKRKKNDSNVFFRRKTLQKCFDAFRNQEDLNVVDLEGFGEFVPVTMSFKEEVSFQECQDPKESGWNVSNRKFFSITLGV